MRVDVIQIDAPGGAHTGEFARPATAVRVQGRDLGGKTGIAGLRAKPVGEGRREPARELARANRRRGAVGKIDEPPGEAVMEEDAGDRKRVVWGKSMAGSVELGVSSSRKNKT